MASCKKEDSEMYIDKSEESALTVGSCMQCEKNVRLKDFPKIIIKAQSRKYCSNLNQFFYSKDINKILSKQRSRCQLYLKEWVMQEFSQECLKRVYQTPDFKEKHGYSHFMKISELIQEIFTLNYFVSLLIGLILKIFAKIYESIRKIFQKWDYMGGCGDTMGKQLIGLK